MKSVTSCVRAALYVATDHSCSLISPSHGSSTGSPKRARSGASSSSSTCTRASAAGRGTRGEWTHELRMLRELVGDSGASTATRRRCSMLSTARNASRSVVSSPATSARIRPCALEQVADRRSLVRADRRQHLEHLAAEPCDEPSSCATSATPRARERLPPRRRGCGNGTRPTSPSARLRRRPRSAAGEVGDLLPPAIGLPVELEAVRADDDHAVDVDALAHVVSGPPADHGDEGIAVTRRASSARVSGGGYASSGRSTMGASTPSKSRKMAASLGAAVRRSSSASVVTRTLVA